MHQETDEHIVGFGLFMGFVDWRKNIELHQTYPLTFVQVNFWKFLLRDAVHRKKLLHNNIIKTENISSSMSILVCTAIKAWTAFSCVCSRSFHFFIFLLTRHVLTLTWCSVRTCATNVLF